MRNVRSIVACVAMVAAGLSAMAAPVAATELGSRTFVGNTDFASFGVGGMRGTGSGTITVAGVSGTPSKALLYWNGPTDGNTSNAAVTFAGHAILGADIGPSDNNCWGFTDSRSYRADVTSLVPGNGTYNLTDFTNGTGADVNGASLIVFFHDGNQANNRDITMVEGNDSNIAYADDPAGWHSTITNVQYQSGVANLQLHVSDGQSYADDAVQINGGAFLPAGQNFDGNSVSGSFSGNFGTVTGNLWDLKNYADITSKLQVGSNNLVLTSGAVDDCLSLVVALVDVPTAHTLTVTVNGTGSGTVTSDQAGISCPGTCSADYSTGTQVVLTAQAVAGSTFSGWSGEGCSGTGTCTVTMDGNRSVTATFDITQYALTVTNPGSGTGTITFSHNETFSSCTLTPSTSCSKSFNQGTVVSLSASAASGSNFSGWSGEGCSGTGTCTVTMNAAKSVIASFNQNSTSDSTTGYVPPGGTIQTCQSTSSTDNTCSAITLPSGGPGATITITEQAGSTSTICNGPCSNQTTFYSITCTPASPCYTDTKKPVKVILRYKLPGTSTKADMYFQKSSTITAFKIPNCLKNGIANPDPCVSARKRLGFGNNDLQVQVLVTSDDPIIGKG